MNAFFAAVAAWFTPDRRQYIQILFGSGAAIAVAFGFGSQGAWEQILIITAAALQFFSSLLSLVNVRDVQKVWAVVRAAVYTLGMAVAPALVILGWIDQETSTTILLGVSLGLTFLSNALAVFVGKKQQYDIAA